MDKLLSVIVPACDMEAYLPTCLGSLLAVATPLLRQLDVVVVNDGSQDRTSAIAHDCARRHPDCVRVLDKANGHYGSCINAALPLVAGRFVRILDADDTYDTAAFEEYLRALAAMPDDVDAVVSDFVWVDETGRVRYVTTHALPADAPFTPATLVRNDCVVVMHGTAYRTALVRAVGYVQLEGICYTDTQWGYFPMAFACRIRYVPLKVYRYLVGRSGQTMSSVTRLRNTAMMDRILERMLEQYEAASRGDADRSYLEFYLQGVFASVYSLHFDPYWRASLGTYLRQDIPQLVAKYPFLAGGFLRRCIFERMPFRFHYAAFVARHPALARPTLFLVNLYLRLRAGCRPSLYRAV